MCGDCAATATARFELCAVVFTSQVHIEVLIALRFGCCVAKRNAQPSIAWPYNLDLSCGKLALANGKW